MTACNNIIFTRMIHLVIILFVFTSLGFTTHRHTCVVMEDDLCDMACSEHPANTDEPPATTSGTEYTNPACHIDTFLGGTAVHKALTGKVFKSDHQYVINSLYTLNKEPVWLVKSTDYTHSGVIRELLIIPAVELFLLNEVYLL
jgi:hypothetical protein